MLHEETSARSYDVESMEDGKGSVQQGGVASTLIAAGQAAERVRVQELLRSLSLPKTSFCS